MILHMTPGERTTLQWLADGRNTSEIARASGLTEDAVHRSLAALCERMGASTIASAVSAAFSRGLVTRSVSS